MKRHTLLLLFLLLLCSGSLQAFSQQSMYDFDIKHWSSSDGLSSNSVRAITQDNQGYIWLGTLYGLNRFDGNQFEHFTTTNQHNLVSNNITQLFKDSKGYIWVGTKSGLTGFDPVSLKFDRYPVLSEVTAIIEIAPGEVWLAADHLFRVKNGQVTRVDKIREQVNQLEKVDDKIWITSSHWLYSYDLTTDVLTSYALPLELIQIPIYDLYWADEQLYLASESGFFALNAKGEISKCELPDKTNTAVYKLLKDSFGNNWISANRKLFHQHDKQEWQYITADELGSSPWFSDIYEDKQHNIWLASFSDGIYRSSLGNINRVLAPGADDVIRSVAVTPQDTLLLAGQSQLGELDANGDYHTLLNTDQLGLGAIFDLYWPTENELWLASTKGVHAYQRQTKSVSLVFDQLENNLVRVLQPDHQGGLWVGGVMGLYHYQNGKLAPFALMEQLETRHITALQQQEDLVLLGTTRGLYQYQQEKLTRLGSGTALFNSYITAVLVLADNTLLASTLDDGVFIRPPQQAWYQLHHGNGLPHSPVVSMVDDSVNNVIWLSSLKGIFRIKHQELALITDAALFPLLTIDEVLSPYDRQLGTIPGRCCNGAGQSKVALWHQRYWYPTLKGVVSVAADLNQQINSPTKPVIKMVQGQSNYPLNSSQPKLLLELNDRSITIHYTALEYIKPTALQFSYQLQGFESSWHDVGPRREAIYTNLPPGNFVFRVQSRFDNQPWSANTITELAIVVPKRFDETLVYRGLWLLLVLFCLYGVLWLLRRNAINKQLQLGQLVKQRTQELENSNLKLNELNEQMALLTYKDNLTGLRNRRFMFEQLPKDIEHFQRNRESMQTQGKGVALLQLDLDNFKQINDQYGNLAGDSCMQQVAWLLIRETRGSDYVVRYSANEFVLVLRDIQIDLVEQFCHQLNDQIARTAFVLPDGHRTHLTCSIGYALYPLALLGGQLINWEISLQLAGISLYHVKHSGKNGVASIHFDQQVDAFEFEDSSHIEAQVERLLAVGLARFNLYKSA
ncbi:ligand-binding sensor domain-containing diguanylate cyclase [Rheinheimera salexigens]|uniref:diguanylate cyclase n=1 Tax=Rheinheimera salexigens TaxID=1628148 RepID=A0A1E7Q5F8_9GAMM|nr:ligand-binding sensor domain-containing diguanylate cyclase [Rheinheimera salexigens]OEY69313.1 diguanylate cyclase [Rheinheimera salexigens]